MKKRAKLDWDSVNLIIPKDIDTPTFNALRNSDGQKVSIPVTLRKGDEKVLHADVDLFQTCFPLYGIALEALLGDIQDHGLSVEWDNAVFTNPDAPFTREQLSEDDWRTKLFRHIRMTYHSSVLSGAFNTMISPPETQRPIETLSDRFAVAILTQSYEVRSDELNDLIRQQNKPLHRKALSKLASMLTPRSI